MNKSYLPQARTEALIVEELDGEVLVFDVDRNRAHCLNSTAAFVWKHCNGRKNAGDIARQLHAEIGKRGATPAPKQDAASIAATEELVWLALSQLNRDHLLIEQSFTPPRVPGISRREALRRVGIGAAIAVPVVASITAPTAVQAGTCKKGNASCSTGAECCSGSCAGGHCL